MTAISATAGVTLLIGAAVLAGAVAAGQERRKYLAVIYKTLGATRLRIIRAELLEFGLLGLATAALAVLIATLTAWALCKWAFEVAFVFSPSGGGRDGAAGARLRADHRRHRHLARAVGQGRALSPGRIGVVRLTRKPLRHLAPLGSKPPYSWSKCLT